MMDLALTMQYPEQTAGIKHNPLVMNKEQKTERQDKIYKT
jgi:hypothetical protein